MTTILLAIGDAALLEPYRRTLERAGHCVVPVQRALTVLSLEPRVQWDAGVVDDSSLGRETLAALRGVDATRPLLGLGLQDPRLTSTLPLPLDTTAVEEALREVLRRDRFVQQAVRLRLNGMQRTASLDGLEVTLTRTEFRLLDLLLQRQPAEVPLIEVLNGVWGFTEGRGTSELVRAHVRNLRSKLHAIGLPDAVRSRRGRGYALVL